MKGGRAGASTEKDPKNSQVPIIVKIDMFAKKNDVRPIIKSTFVDLCVSSADQISIKWVAILYL